LQSIKYRTKARRHFLSSHLLRTCIPFVSFLFRISGNPHQLTPYIEYQHIINYIKFWKDDSNNKILLCKKAAMTISEIKKLLKDSRRSSPLSFTVTYISKLVNPAARLLGLLHWIQDKFLWSHILGGTLFVKFFYLLFSPPPPKKVPMVGTF